MWLKIQHVEKKAQTDKNELKPDRLSEIEFICETISNAWWPSRGTIWSSVRFWTPLSSQTTWRDWVWQFFELKSPSCFTWLLGRSPEGLIERKFSTFDLPTCISYLSVQNFSIEVRVVTALRYFTLNSITKILKFYCRWSTWTWACRFWLFSWKDTESFCNLCLEKKKPKVFDHLSKMNFLKTPKVFSFCRKF